MMLYSSALHACPASQHRHINIAAQPLANSRITNGSHTHPVVVNGRVDPLLLRSRCVGVLVLPCMGSHAVNVASGCCWGEPPMPVMATSVAFVCTASSVANRLVQSEGAPACPASARTAFVFLGSQLLPHCSVSPTHLTLGHTQLSTLLAGTRVAACPVSRKGSPACPPAVVMQSKAHQVQLA